jgi:hypothetical protein
VKIGEAIGDHLNERDRRGGIWTPLADIPSR